MDMQTETRGRQTAEDIGALADKLAQFPETLLDKSGIPPLREVSGTIVRAVQEYAREGRKLRIGIVGQVKVGKSSFLNALLFEGQDLLPKAATPMTAALTFISYAEEPQADVEFYTREDWGIMENLSNEYDQIRQRLSAELSKRHGPGRRLDERETQAVTQVRNEANDARTPQREMPMQEQLESRVREEAGDDLVAAHELVSRVRREHLDVDAYLGKKESLKGQDVESLLHHLEQYVGANGKYTPFTRNTHIYLNKPILRDIEVVDTPGTNDPIVSRTHITDEFLATCDCVLLLCYSGQFMGQEDVAFLLQSLPSQGISRVLLVGTKFDSVLLDEARRYRGDLTAAVRDVRRKLEEQACETLLPAIEANPGNPTCQAVRGCLPPLFVSALCYSVSKKGRQGELSETESHILSSLRKSFQDFDFTPDALLDLANIDRIRDRDMKKLLVDKEGVQARKLADLLTGQLRVAAHHVIDLRKDAAHRLDQICTKDAPQVEANLRSAEKALTKCRESVLLVFSNVTTRAALVLNDLALRLAKEADAAKNLSIEDKREVVGRESLGWKFWGWFRNRDIYGTVKYANVRDAVFQVCRYVRYVNEEVSREWKLLLNPKDLASELVDAVTPSFDLRDKSFEYEDVVNPVRRAANELTIPSLDIDSEKYEGMVVSKFSAASTVSGSDVEKLQALQRTVVSQILNDVKREIGDRKEEVNASLKIQGESFLGNVTQKFRDEAGHLAKLLEDRSQAMRRCEELIAVLDAATKDLERVSARHPSGTTQR